MIHTHLNVPSHWQHYWTKYPEGYTILEALLNWVNQVNEMTDNLNDMNVRLDDFLAQFDEELQDTVALLLTEMKENGDLADIINVTVFNDLNDKIDSLAIIPEKEESETDWTAAIHRAVDKAMSTGKKKIYFPAGTYEHTGIILTDCEGLTVDGHKGATLKLTEMTHAHCIDIQSPSVKIMNITIQGSLVSGDSDLGDYHGINISSVKGCHITGVYIHRTKGHGVNLGNVNQISDSRIAYTGGEGYHIGADCNVANCQAGATGSHGFNFAGGHTTASSVYSWMAGNNETMGLYNVQDTYGIRVSANSITISSFNVFAANRYGVWTGNCIGLNLSGTINNCGRLDYYNASYGLYLNNTKGSVFNVSVINTGEVSENTTGDEGWIKTALYVANPEAGSTNNILNVTAYNVENFVGTNDSNNLDKTNFVSYNVNAEEAAHAYKFISSDIETSLSHSTQTFVTPSPTTNGGYTVTGESVYVPVKGVYSITFNTSVTANESGSRIFSILKGSKTVASATNNGLSVSGNGTLTATLYLIPTNQLRFRLFQNSGETLTATSDIEIHYLHS